MKTNHLLRLLALIRQRYFKQKLTFFAEKRRSLSSFRANRARFSAVILMSGLSALLNGAGRAGTASDAPSRSEGQATTKHFTAAGGAGNFYGWPANNGAWTWDGGREILVGFSYGRFVEQEGHNTFEQKDYDGLARSLDGGITWKIESSATYVPDDSGTSPSPGGFVFDAPGFAMRVKYGRVLVSQDRGKSWQGPYHFGSLTGAEELAGMRLSSRTGYVVTGRQACLIFMSAQPHGKDYADKSFVVETTDGGRTFQFISWIVPRDDPHRAVMPSPVRLADGTLVVALRRRIPEVDEMCWLDCYGSSDNGRTWTFLSKIAETGKHNGNPPALAVLNDGRVACAYGDRTRIKMYLRLSADGGNTWGDELVLRDDFQMDKFGERDFGYPRLVRNDRGELVVLYYWATRECPQQQIMATIWRPESKQRL